MHTHREAADAGDKLLVPHQGDFRVLWKVLKLIEYPLIQQISYILFHPKKIIQKNPDT